MAEAVSFRPPRDRWTAAIYGSEAGGEPLGAVVLIAERRVLTCAHVVKTHTPIWVALPKAGVARGVRRRAAEVRAASEADLAVLVLAEPAPPGVVPARAPPRAAAWPAVAGPFLLVEELSGGRRCVSGGSMPPCHPS